MNENLRKAIEESRKRAEDLRAALGQAWEQARENNRLFADLAEQAQQDDARNNASVVMQ
jgi:hypothetical protein